MNNLDAILEIAIGLVLTWLIISATTMEIQNFIGNILDRRSKFLEKAIRNMFKGDQSAVDAFYKHPLIKTLYKKSIFGKPIKPDYIPNKYFAEAALDIFSEFQNSNKIEEIAFNIDHIAKNQELQYFINRLTPNFQNRRASGLSAHDLYEKAVEFKKNADIWFNDSMQQASYMYKEAAKSIAFIIGVTLAVIFNIDTIHITKELWREPTLRQSLIAQAQNVSESTDASSVAQLKSDYEDLNIPVGWGSQAMPANWQGWANKIFGLLLTGFAAMQGAPFWFDILRKLINFKNPSENNHQETPPPPPMPSDAEPEPVG